MWDKLISLDHLTRKLAITLASLTALVLTPAYAQSNIKIPESERISTEAAAEREQNKTYETVEQETEQYKLSLKANKLAQGSLATLEIEEKQTLDNLVVDLYIMRKGRSKKVNVPVIEKKGNKYFALVGFDLNTTPDDAWIVVNNNKKQALKIPIQAGDFEVEEVWLPKRLADKGKAESSLAEKIRERIRRERSEFYPSWKPVSLAKYWNGDFIMPVVGRCGKFGAKRLFNGEPRSQHKGFDCSSEAGIPILAPNNGIVAYTGDNLYYFGNTVVLDHGFGMYTLYGHLAKMDVKQGDLLKTGDVIGTVGQTGRATGPHLHWQLKWLSQNINPEDLGLLNKEFEFYDEKNLDGMMYERAVLLYTKGYKAEALNLFVEAAKEFPDSLTRPMIDSAVEQICKTDADIWPALYERGQLFYYGRDGVEKSYARAGKYFGFIRFLSQIHDVATEHYESAVFSEGQAYRQQYEIDLEIIKGWTGDRKKLGQRNAEENRKLAIKAYQSYIDEFKEDGQYSKAASTWLKKLEK